MNMISKIVHTRFHSAGQAARLRMTERLSCFHPMKRCKRREPFFSSRTLFAGITVLCLAGFLYSVSQARRTQEALAAQMAPQVLRFHVLANSDSPEDQTLKLEVRSLLLDEIYAGICDGGQSSGSAAEVSAANVSSANLSAANVPATDLSASKEEIRDYIAAHKDELEQDAETYMANRGYAYPAEIRFETCYFPTKQYGDMTFPCGSYDAVRVLLGEGKGKNWWCVLYPPLCFSGVTASAQVPDSSKETLEALIPDEDYRWLTGKRRLVFGDGENGQPGAVHVRLRLLELFQR